jgi:hypothetical protein
MYRHQQHTTAIKRRRMSLDDVIGRIILLIAVVVCITLIVAREQPAASPTPANVTVAPVNPAEIAALVREHEALRERLAVTVAPVDPLQIAALVRQHQASHESGQR